MEDYKQKYENALEWAKNLYNSKHADLNLRITLEDVFPELEKSEDERIRKEILSFLKEFEHDHYRNLDFSSWIVWLEKQGNFIKWQTNSKDNKPKNNHSVLMQTIHGIAEGEWRGEEWYQYRWSSIVRDSDVLSWIELSELEKQGVQKPTDKVEPKFKVGDVIKNINNGDTVKIEQILDNYYCYSGWDGAATIHSDFTISEQDNWKLIEQNSSWSEEDEKCCNTICFVLHDLEVTLEDKKLAEKWLKSLKERMKGE